MSLTAILLILGLFNTITNVMMLYVIYKKENPSLCDCCKYLDRKGMGTYKYDCKKRGRFDWQPKICSDWSRKEM